MTPLRNPAQERRLRALSAQHSAVSAHPVNPLGATLLVCRADDGIVRHAEVLSGDGARLPASTVLELLAAERRRALEAEARATDALVALLGAGELTVSEVSRATGLSRTTLHKRLDGAEAAA